MKLQGLGAVIFLLILPSCTTAKYLFQAGHGQLEISSEKRSNPEVIEDAKTPSYVKRLLKRVPRIKDFGEKYDLKPTSNYESYVPLERDAATWVVSACRPLAFEPKTWSFPFFGSFTYLGWFDREQAQSFAQSLRKEGWEVYLRGAGAYSTLGWFEDPVFSTMLSKSKAGVGQFVNTILHESVHTTFYVDGQSYFNESLANFVANRLTRRYFQSVEDSPELKQAYLESRERRQKSNQRFFQAYQDLEEVYQSDQSKSWKRKQKKSIIQELKTDLGLERKINNAVLIQFRTYHSGFPSFQKLFQSCSKDWGRFWEQIRSVSEDDFKKAQQKDMKSLLKPLIEECLSGKG